MKTFEQNGVASTRVISEIREKIKVIKIVKNLRESKYVNGFYIKVQILDDKNRLMIATGRWIENLQDGDEIEGIVQKRVSRDKDGWNYENYYLENPNNEYKDQQN